MSLKYNKNHYEVYRKRFYENPSINPISGYNIDKTKLTYQKLIKEFGDPEKQLKEFSYFDQLPEDLQSEIFSQELSTLKRSPYISKFTNKATTQKLCQLAITNIELMAYVHDVVPEKLYVFPSGLRPTTKFNVNKFHLIQPPLLKNDYQLGYNSLIEWISVINNVVTLHYEYVGNDVSRFNNLVIGNIESDLLTSYYIYKRRISCQNIPNYAKNQILKKLQLESLKIKNNYVELLYWYMYLRTNLLSFPIQLLKNPYFDYKVTMDNKGNITSIDHNLGNQIIKADEGFEILIDLKTSCDALYNQLLQQLNGL